MILFEFEGKELLSKYGINIPKGQLVSFLKEKVSIKPPFIVKAQVLSGKRKDAGGIGDNVADVLGKIVNKEEVTKVLVEERVAHDLEYYVSISYDTKSRGPVLTFSESGGTGIEQKKVQTFEIDPIDFSFKSVGLPKEFLPVVLKLIEAFFFSDLLLLEINPLVISKNGQVVALDAKIKTDDTSVVRHPEWNFPPRSVPGHVATDSEIAAKKIDEGDYRGTAGAAYFDLPGDVAILSSGGGVSLTALDALISHGGSPANFTEYSGNPPKEKVVKLTKIVLNKPDIHGLWVIGTVVANFTDIYETLSGLIEGLREAEKELKKKFDFPIVIRRGGPRDKEAFEMLKKVRDFNLILQGKETSIEASAKIMAAEAKKYANGKKIT